MPGDLFPVFVTAPIDLAPAAPERLFGKAFRWNFTEDDFEVDGNGRLVEVDEKEAFVQWCVLAATVERGAHPVYSGQFGIEKQRVLDATPDVVESEAEVVITEALATTDNRVYLVGGFQFAREGPTLSADFTIVPVEGSPEPMSISIGE
jgi:uncharacterized protein DUF2634